MADLVEPTLLSEWWENFRGQFSDYQLVVPSDPIPTGPDGRAWRMYRQFTLEVVDIMNEGGETASNLMLHGFLDKVYLKTPRHFAKKWIRSAYLANPRDNSPAQIMFISIVNVQSKHPEFSMLDKVRSVEHSLREWKEDAYALKNLIEDPSVNWLFTLGHSVRSLSSSTTQFLVEQNTECPICVESFEANSSSLKYPCKGPCEHIICLDCFDNWVSQVCYGQWHTDHKRSFTCPLCRQCLCCGQSDCGFHVLDHDERVRPVPLSAMLNRFLEPSGHGLDSSELAAPSVQPLHGFTEEQYHSLRLQTRPLRADLARVNTALEQHGEQGDRISRNFEADRDAIVDELEAMVIEFKDKPCEYPV